MKDSTIVNTELEQALYTGSSREQALRSRAALAILAPLIAGALWLFYSGWQLHALQARTRKLEDEAAIRAQQDAQIKAQTAQAEQNRAAAEARAASANQAQKSAQEQIASLKATLAGMRGELDDLELSVGEISTVRAKVAGLNNSEPIESQLGALRTSLSKGFASLEKQIDKALPDTERKSKVHIFITDEDQRAAARQLKSELEANGFEVAGIIKNTSRKLDSSEVRYFRKDKAEAQQIEAILEKQLGKTDCRLTYTDDPVNAGGSARKYQVWLKRGGAR